MKETLSHRQLQSLIHVSNVLNSSLDIDTIIDSIMVQTVSVIDAAHGGVLFIYDPKQDLLIPKSDSNFKSEITRVRLKPGESMTGLAFTAQKCLIFHNRTEVEKATATLSETNHMLMDQSIPTLPYSSICAPILLKGECIGVITLDSFDQSLHFIPEDINLLTAIAHQAAVALEKANLYSEQEETVRQLEELNNTISKQNEMLSRSVDIHNRLAALVLHGEGLDSIITYLNETTGHNVLLYDDLGELISYAYKDKLSDDELYTIRELAQNAIKTPGNVRSFIETNMNKANQCITVLPIGAKPTLYGSLIIVSPEKMRDVDIAALEHACTVISLELVKDQAIFDAQEKINGELIDVLFSGKVDGTILQKAKQMDFDPMGDYLAVIIRLDEMDNTHKRNSIIRHLVQLANRVFLKNSLKGMAVRNHDQIVVLLTFQQKVSPAYAHHQVKELVSKFQQEIQVKNWGTNVSIGIGRIHSSLLKVTKSMQEAAKCLQFLQSYGGKNQVISYKELGVQRLLLQNTEEELIDFIMEVLGPLFEYDQSRKGELLPSLFAYLEHNQNAKEAAESIHVHTNTLMYRLKRIEEILSTDLSDSQQFLNIHLAVSLYPFIKEKLTPLA
ncbi:helix-turn-helix domain-containing protein [Bacillus sp. ISL-40]|uniref:helix-turn-helix domain-containing protein n=1 Tax=unclassified Bacillus (in: firmicutes) TaxID=185979 RepID=UPI001BEB81EF|nr:MULTISPECIES: helix-turn-helix domain-containing protein [unclassified Bacillus (in: firmicutes)]MBT2696276.1 helix-turn-helix domain-containing protein [Bacillus sp. ISL-40]MBT2720432.1 helix-turn-helix domain-containing protein [Bacillus sp. ISL-46]MBT2743125.1 helix-turn-helix domain-containing protein [Bacillus sp. ISL-77]